jgi:hypothetical protein
MFIICGKMNCSKIPLSQNSTQLSFLSRLLKPAAIAFILSAVAVSCGAVVQQDV